MVITEVLVLLLLILVNAIFAASEIALISLNDNKIKSLADAGDKKAELLHRLLSEPSRFLATVQIGITLAGFLASAFAADSFAGRLAEYIYGLGVPVSLKVLQTTAMIVITLILSYFTLVLGELVPKRIAMQKSEAISMFAVKPLTVLSKVSAPFVHLLTGSTNVLVRLFGLDPHANKEEVTEEEIRMMVDVGNESGAIQEDEKVMINNIFDLDNKSVSDIMIHRSHVVAIPKDITLKELAHLITTEKYTRFPVYDGDIDNIIGVLHAKDIIQFIGRDDKDAFDLQEIIRKPYLIPTSKRVDDLFKEFQKHHVHLAIAIDEYGGTAGIVTTEDMLEEIVGSIVDEYDEEEKEVERLDEHTLLMKGSISLHVLRSLLHVEFQTEDYGTLNGFLISQLGRIPLKGERPVIVYEGITFQVQEVNEKRISKVKVIMPSPSEY